MTLSSKQTKVIYTTNGETQYPIPFFFFEAGDIECLRVHGAEEEQLSGFSVDRLSSGWAVSFGQALPKGQSLVIRRRTERVQETNYPEGGKFPSTVVEGNFDRIVGMVQEIGEELDRAIKVQANEDSAPSAESFWAELQGFSSAAAMSAETAEVSALRAEDAAGTAADEAGQATVAADRAEAAGAAAEASETAAKASEAASSASETTAAESASLATQSALGLQEALTEAARQAGIAADAAGRAEADAGRTEADKAAAASAANHAEERAGFASTEANRAEAAADRAGAIVDIGIGEAGKPGLVAPDGVTTFVDPASGELHVEVGPGVTFDGVTIRQDAVTGDHYVPVAGVTQPGALIPLTPDGTGGTPDALLGARDNAGTLEQIWVPAAEAAVGKADRFSADRQVRLLLNDGKTVADSVNWDGSAGLDLQLPALEGGSGRSPVTAANFQIYVAATGSDANDGLTTETPKLTLTGALELLKRYRFYYGTVIIRVIGAINAIDAAAFGSRYIFDGYTNGVFELVISTQQFGLPANSISGISNIWFRDIRLKISTARSTMPLTLYGYIVIMNGTLHLQSITMGSDIRIVQAINSFVQLNGIFTLASGATRISSQGIFYKCLNSQLLLTSTKFDLSSSTSGQGYLIYGNNEEWNGSNILILENNNSTAGEMLAGNKFEAVTNAGAGFGRGISIKGERSDIFGQLFALCGNISSLYQGYNGYTSSYGGQGIVIGHVYINSSAAYGYGIFNQSATRTDPGTYKFIFKGQLSSVNMMGILTPLAAGVIRAEYSWGTGDNPPTLIIKTYGASNTLVDGNCYIAILCIS